MTLEIAGRRPVANEGHKPYLCLVMLLDVSASWLAACTGRPGKLDTQTGGNQSPAFLAHKG